MRNAGRHDDRNGEVGNDTVCTCAFKLSYDREDRELDPISGSNYLMGGDYCGVIVKSKTNPSNSS